MVRRKRALKKLIISIRHVNAVLKLTTTLIQRVSRRYDFQQRSRKGWESELRARYQAITNAGISLKGHSQETWPTYLFLLQASQTAIPAPQIIRLFNIVPDFALLLQS